MGQRSWQFDIDFLRQQVKNGQNLLKERNVSSYDKKMIKENMTFFEEILSVMQGTYKEVNSKPKKLTNTIKDLYLQKIKSDSIILEENFIDLIISIAEGHLSTDLGQEQYYLKNKPLNIVNNSLEVYKEFAPDFIKPANFIIEHPVSLINFYEQKMMGSECYFDELSGLPFIHVSEQNSFPPSFIHELQHGIGAVLNYKTHPFYNELGSILFETLYIDKMVEKPDEDSALLYQERILETEALLDYLACYFKALKEFKKYNFSISHTKFFDILLSNNVVYNDEEEIIELLELDTYECLCYVLSFLKGLEVREKIYHDKKFGLKLLKKLLTHDRLCLEKDSIKTIRTYDSYLDEVKIKIKEMNK